MAIVLAGTGYSAKAEGDNRPLPPTLSFVGKGHLLARRGHQTIQVRTMNLNTLDVTITHAGEADAMSILTHDPGETKGDQEIWHGEVIPAPASGPGNARLDEPAIASIDVLRLVPALQPGIYRVTVSAGPFGTISTWLTISNLGIEAFTGSDGIQAQIRLLSETTPAQNVEVALVSGNNRELARLRTDPDGVARFSGPAVSGAGNDAPAALYAYGADGEFTALLLTGAPVLFEGAAINRSGTFPAAWIETERSGYRAGQPVQGFALARQAEGRNVAQPLYVQLRDAKHELMDEQRVVSQPGGLGAFTLHTPPDTDGKWTIDLVDSAAHILGTSDFETGESAVQPAAPATISPATQQQIVIAPGRRTFQAGEMANISVTPPVDSDVTVALLDTSTRAIARQHIGKDGAVVQIPVPADANGGLYVLATAFTPPDEAAGHPMQRVFGLQWLDIDQGQKRMGVRLDTPESAAAGSNVPVKIALPDLADKPGSFAVIGTNAKDDARPDPIGYFYGRRPVGVVVRDDYADVIGGNAQPALPDFTSVTSRQKQPGIDTIIWNGPNQTTGGNAVVSIETPRVKDVDRVRLSIIAASDDKIGIAETGMTITAGPARKADKQKSVPVSKTKIVTLAQHGSVALKGGQAMYLSSVPIVAAPLWIDDKEVAHYQSSADPDTLSLIRAANNETAIDELSALQMIARQADIPDETRTILRQKLTSAAISGKPTGDPMLLALYALYQGGETPLWAQSLAQSAKPGTRLARLCRLALLNDDEDFKALSNSDDDDDDDTMDRIMAVMVIQQIATTLPRSIPLPDSALKSLSGLASGPHQADWREMLGLRAIQARMAANPHIPHRVIKTDKPMAVRLSGSDPAMMYGLVLSGWPTQPPQ